MLGLKVVKILGQEKCRLEGIQCTISIDSVKSADFDPFSNVMISYVPQNVVCSISLKYNTIEISKSSPFESSLLETNEYLCIPLFPIKQRPHKAPQDLPSFSAIYLNSINCNQSIIKNCKNLSVDTHQNIRESDEKFDGSYQTNAKIINSSRRNCYPDQKLTKGSKDFREVVDEITKKINHDLEISVRRYQKLIEIDKLTKESLIQEIKKLKSELSREQDEFKKREKTILNDVQNFEASNFEMKFELMKIKTESKAVIAENNRLLKLISDQEASNLRDTSITKQLQEVYSNDTVNLGNLLKKLDEITGNASENNDQELIISMT